QSLGEKRYGSLLLLPGASRCSCPRKARKRIPIPNDIPQRHGRGAAHRFRIGGQELEQCRVGARLAQLADRFSDRDARASYSIHLWQQPFLNRYASGFPAAFPANLIALVVVSSAAWFLIERPSLVARAALYGFWRRAAVSRSVAGDTAPLRT